MSPFGLVAAPKGEPKARPPGLIPLLFEWFGRHTSPMQMIRVAGPFGLHLTTSGVGRRCGRWMSPEDAEAFAQYMHRNWVAGGHWGGAGPYVKEGAAAPPPPPPATLPPLLFL